MQASCRLLFQSRLRHHHLREVGRSSEQVQYSTEAFLPAVLLQDLTCEQSVDNIVYAIDFLSARKLASLSVLTLVRETISRGLIPCSPHFLQNIFCVGPSGVTLAGATIARGLVPRRPPFLENRRRAFPCRRLTRQRKCGTCFRRAVMLCIVKEFAWLAGGA